MTLSGIVFSVFIETLAKPRDVEGVSTLLWMTLSGMFFSVSIESLLSRPTVVAGVSGCWVLFTASAVFRGCAYERGLIGLGFISASSFPR